MGSYMQYIFNNLSIFHGGCTYVDVFCPLVAEHKNITNTIEITTATTKQLIRAECFANVYVGVSESLIIVSTLRLMHLCAIHTQID